MTSWFLSRPLRRVLFACLVLLGLAGSSLLPTAAWAEPRETYSVHVPILMYHYVRTVTNPRDRVGLDLSVTPAHFAQQMALLYKNGFHTVTLDDLLSSMLDGTPLPSKPIIITFDDGYEDYYTAAFPVLEEYGFRSTSFVITGVVGRPAYMSWNQMRMLESSGLVQFESHTVDHSDMGHMSVSRARFEMVQSKRALESQLGVQVDYFCYPSGHYNAGVLSLLASAGYRAGVGTAYGSWHSLADIQALHRVRIHGSDSLSSFAAKLGLASK